MKETLSALDCPEMMESGQRAESLRFHVMAGSKSGKQQTVLTGRGHAGGSEPELVCRHGAVVFTPSSRSAHVEKWKHGGRILSDNRDWRKGERLMYSLSLTLSLSECVCVCVCESCVSTHC